MASSLAKLALSSAAVALAASETAAPEQLQAVLPRAAQCLNADCEVTEETALIQQFYMVHAGPIDVLGQQDLAATQLSQIQRQAPNSTNASSAASAAMGVNMNAAGDMNTFLTSLVMYSFGCMVLVTGFMILRQRYPLVYSNNVLKGFAPSTPPEKRFGWLYTAWGTTTEEAAASIGLDNAMLLEFTGLCMRILSIIGFPMVCIMGPMHLIFGGGVAGEDHLSYFSFGNVENGSWLYWVHAFVVWGVVFTVQANIYGAQQRFLGLRYAWLRGMPAPRATTVLVEEIPEQYRSDAALKGFFEKMFDSSAIETAYVVKHTQALEAAIARKENATYGLEKAQGTEGSSQGANLEYYEKEVAAAEEQIKEERAKVNDLAKNIGGVNASAGFVTFKDRSLAEQAKNLQFGADSEVWQVSTPPDSASVIWSDLQLYSTRAAGKTLIGYGLVAGLYIVYLPLTIWITNIATRINFGPFQPLWASFAPTAGLQFMVAFLPTFLIWIFRLFFVLRDETWEQQRLQNWYFVFNVVFVIMVTAIGSNVMAFTRTLATFTCSPIDTFTLLGTAMPQATHFYMNYMVLQWVTHCLNLTRFMPLFKFKAACAFFEEERARELAEPEDQDYYGLGSRSARFTTNMLIGIIYGTLCPWMYPLVFMNFFVCRTVYGYLIPFAETKKGDLGGVFWVHQLKHLFVGNIIYVFMMTGVLYGRSATSGPAWISGVSLFYVLWSYYRFNTAFAWEKLPYEEIKANEFKAGRDDGVYVQPCMLEGK